MHRLHALPGYRRAVEVEGDPRVAIAQHERIRRSSIYRKIGCLDTCWDNRVAQVDNEIRRLRIYDATASRGCGGHGKAHQLSVGKGILLGLPVDNVAPVHPCSHVLILFRRQGCDYVRKHIIR